MLAIDAKNVIKQYKGSQTPLNSISIEVQSDQISTFLGRNGAGKTTFVRMCATQLMPTSGSIGVLGYDAINCADRVRELITIVPQEGRPLRALTPWDHVYNWLQIRGEYKDEARRRAREMLEKLELWQNKDTPAMYLSGGMKQKILVAMAMAVDAELLFLDEPNLEVISSLEPDLIVTTSGYYEVAYDELSAIAPTIELDYFASPNGTSTEFELMDESTMKLADALGKHDEGVKLLQERDTKLMEAKSKLEAAGAGEDRFVLLYTDVSEGIPSLTLLYNNSKPS